MQKQKTIAKWLAIILLLTVIVACYIVLRAIFNNTPTVNSPDIAGADDPPDSQNPNVPTIDDKNKPPVPVYSEFPRSAETVNGITVRHVGGEDNEVLLDTIYYFGRRIVFFYTASAQYDVKEAGIHMAIFVGDILTNTYKIADVQEQFVKASIVQNGLLIITKNSGETKLRLLDDDLQLAAQSSCPVYSSYQLYVTGSTTRMFVSDGRYIYALSISSSLGVSRSNFVYQLENAQILQAMDLGFNNVVFVQSTRGVGLLSYNQNMGFIYKCELSNSVFMQLLPIVVSSKQAVAILASTNSGVNISSIDESLSVQETYLIRDASSAVALRANSGNIDVIADSKQYSFCSHLELQSVNDIEIDAQISSAMSSQSTTLQDKLVYTAIDDENNIFVISNGSAYCIAELTQNSLKYVFGAVGNKFMPIRDYSLLGTSPLSVLMSGTSANSFAYMCFGKNDVFYLTLPYGTAL